MAFDVDLDAVFEARRNLRRNAPSGVWLHAGGIESLSGTFDYFLVNLIYEEAAPLLAPMAARCSAGGFIALSGILDEREAQASASLELAGWSVIEVARDGEWRTIRAQKCPGHP